MLDYEVIKKDKKRLLALTGLTRAECEQLLPYFQRAYVDRYEGNILPNGKKRQRAIGGGRGSGLKSIEQKQLFILTYVKTYPLQVVMGELFEISESGANEWIHKLLPVLQDALEWMGVKPQREGKDFATTERGRGEGKDFIVDGTDRRRQSPKDPENQGTHYSGKKKTNRPP